MQYTINLTSKGQMTLPKAAREKIGVKPRDKVLVRVDSRGVTILKAPELEEIWSLTKTGKRWPGDAAVDKILAKAKKAEYAKKPKNRT